MSNTIVFFGSGPVAAASLRLLAGDFEIEAVITKPRLPHHHGDVPVLRVCDELGLPVLSAATKTELDELFSQKPVSSQLAILIDFGIIVSQAVIDYFPLGIINSHFSVLPDLRGADPISFSILSGQASTGVSLMQLVAAMDEGPLLAYGEYELPKDITSPLLTEHLINFSHQLLLRTIPGYIADPKPGEAQSVTGRSVSYSHKLKKADGILDWRKPVAVLEREVRAYLEWPRSRARLGGIDVVITACHQAQGSGAAGSLYLENKQLGVYASDGLLIIDSLLPAGKKEMPASAFLAGYRPTNPLS